MEGVGHIRLGALAGDEILFRTALTGHLVDQGDGLGLGGEQIVVAVCLQHGQHITGAGYGQLRVAKADEGADVQVVRDLTDRQLPVEPSDVHGINRHDTKLLQAVLPAGSRA